MKGLIMYSRTQKQEASDLDGLSNAYWKSRKGKRFKFRGTISNRGEEENSSGKIERTLSFRNLFYAAPTGSDWIPFRGHLWIRDGNKWSDYVEGDVVEFEAKLTTYQKVDKNQPDGLVEKISFKSVKTPTIKLSPAAQ